MFSKVLNLYSNLALTSPSIDPTNATILTRKQTTLKPRSKMPFVVQTFIFFWTIYISTGKYIDKGQKPKAPNTPKT